MITYTITPNQRGAELSIPANFVLRATGYNFIHNGSEAGNLTENDLDSSDSYTVSNIPTVVCKLIARDYNLGDCRDAANQKVVFLKKNNKLCFILISLGVHTCLYGI